MLQKVADILHNILTKQLLFISRFENTKKILNITIIQRGTKIDYQDKTIMRSFDLFHDQS